MHADRRDTLVSTLAQLGLAVAVFAGVLFPLTNTDIWWHLAAGRWMVEHAAPLTVDTLSADVAGQRWTDVHWIFQLLVFSNHRLGGVLALVLLKCALTTAAALLLLRTFFVANATRGSGPDGVAASDTRTGEVLVAAALIALPIYLARYLVLARPIVISLLCISAVLLILERYRVSRRPRALLWLLPVQLLWANTQGLFLLGPAIVGCYLAGDTLALLLGRGGFDGFGSPLRPRQLAWLALAVPVLLAASLVSPHGWANLALPLRLFGRIDPVGSELFSLNVSENMPPWLLERLHHGRVGYFKWVAAAAFGSFLLTHRRPPLARLVLLGAMFSLALIAYRNVLLFCWLAGAVAAANLLQWHRARPPSRHPSRGHRGLRCATVAAGVLLAALPAHRLLATSDSGDLGQPAPFRIPQQATATLARLGLAGDLFNSVRYGGYLAWALPGRHRPTIDGRLVLRSATRFAEHLRAVDDPRRFFDFAGRRGPKLAMLPTAFPDRYLRLAAALYLHPDWRLLYTDGTQALFAHREAPGASRRGSDRVAAVNLDSSQVVGAIADELERRHAAQPAIAARALVHLGQLLAEVGQLDRAAEVLSREGAVDRDHFASNVLARVHYLAGRGAQARALSHRLLARDPRDVNSLVLLALLDADARRYHQAIGWAGRALALDPHNQQARRLLARVKHEQRGADAR